MSALNKNTQVAADSDTHPHVDALTEFVNGRLDDARSSVVEAHLESCAACCRVLARLSAQSDPFVDHLVEAVGSDHMSVSDAESCDANQSDSPMGTVARRQTPDLIGRFEIRRQIGEGGFGVVLLAYDPKLQREVALKIPRPGSFLNAETRKRFLREARASAALDHPHIVAVYEASEDDEICYIASAYCRGPNLSTWLKEQKDPVAFSTAAQLLADLSAAVQHAHLRNVLHRDLKPSNVLLDPVADSTLPKITDFGLAKVVGEGPETTKSNVVMGTAAYMSPEQASGRVKDVRPYADIYSLGAILYELLTGRPPFVGETELETIQRVQSEEPIPPARLRPKLPRDLETICLTCLQKEPRRRYDSAAALGDDLQRFLRGEPVQARRAGRAERAWRWCHRNPVTAALITLIAALVLVVTVGSLVFGIVQRDLVRAAEEARKDERSHRRLLEQTLENQHVRRAVEDRLDPPTALLSAVQALRLNTKDPLGQEMHRVRIAATLKRASGWRHTWLHGGPVRFATFSPDGRWVASCCEDGSARVWNAETGAAVTDPLRHDGPVVRAAFDPGCKLLATASTNGYARMWNMETGAPLGDRLEHGAALSYVGFSPGGEFLVTADVNDRVCMWDADTGRCIRRIEERGGRRAAFSRDGLWMVTSGRVDGMAWVWNLRDQEPKYKLRHGKHVRDAAFSPDGRHLATAAAHQAVLWDLADVERRHSLQHDNVVMSVAFNEDGSQLITAGSDAVARVWRVTDGANLARLPHDAPVSTAVFSLTGKHITACSDGTIRAWRPEYFGMADEKILRHAGAIRSLQVGPGGILTASDDGTMRLWRDDGSNGGQRLAKHDGIAFAVRYSSDGRVLLSAGFDNSAILIDRTTGQSQRLPHEAPVLAVEFSSDARHLLTASADGRAIIWDRPSATRRHVLDHGSQGSTYAEFNAEGTSVVTICGDNFARLWNTDSGEELAVATAKSKLELARFMPDGNHLVLAGNHSLLWNGSSGPLNNVWFSVNYNLRGRDIVFDHRGSRMAVIANRVVHIHDTRSGERLASGFRHHSKIRSVAFSPDGRYLATAGTDQVARIWDSATAEPVTGEMRHPGDVLRVEFSPDGRMLATTTIAAHAFVWDTSTGMMLAMIPHGGAVWDVRFHPDGRELVTVCGRGDVAIYSLEPDRRSADRLQAIAEILSGQQLRNDGQRMPLDAGTFARRIREYLKIEAHQSLRLPTDWHLK